MHKTFSRLTLRGALGAAALVALLSGCTRTEVTEMHCVRVADDHLAAPREQSDETLVCNPRRVRQVYRDQYFEPPVVTDETW